MNGTRMLERLQLIGASGGAAFAVLALVAYLLNPGPSSGYGITVVEYYATHGRTTTWQAALVGVAAICLIWFAETFAGLLPLTPAGVVGAAVTAALYLVAIGCWNILGEIYGGVDITIVPSERFGDANVLYDVGVGAANMGHFAAAAFVGATAAAMLAAGTPWRLLGWLGMGLAAFRLISALIKIASTSSWSDAVATAGFFAFLLWVFLASVMLVLASRRSATPPASEQAAA